MGMDFTEIGSSETCQSLLHPLPRPDRSHQESDGKGSLTAKRLDDQGSVETWQVFYRSLTGKVP